MLVAEDHDDTRFLLRCLLGARGYEVAEATNGEEAVEAAERLRPLLILMDGSLPGLDGFAATRRMRQLSTLEGVPIVFLSGHAEPAAMEEARRAGCDDYLMKPLDMEKLDRVLKRFCDGDGDHTRATRRDDSS